MTLAAILQRLGSVQQCAFYPLHHNHLIFKYSPFLASVCPKAVFANALYARVDISELMQSPEESDPSPSSSLRRWHPKVTPYRLLVLGTTMGVGTTKAMAAQRGDEGASTTLEWVSGVVIFLILHTMSTYDESPKEPPPLLGWMFTVDCIDYVWRFLSFLHISRPSYSSAPQAVPHLIAQSEKDHTANAVPVTLYRLCVCFTTVSFGLTKAALVYFGFSTGANWVDWTLGVVGTSILFMLGMYENNTTGKWHAFFVPDHSTETQYGVSLIALTLMSLLWIATCFWMMYLMTTNQYSAFLSTDDNLISLSELTRLALLREKLFHACLVLLIVLVIVVSTFIGVVSIAAIMTSSGMSKWKLAADKLMGKRPAGSKKYTQLESPVRRLANRVVSSPLSFVIFQLGCAVFLAFWVVSIAANVEKENHLRLQTNTYGVS
ncbi:hypothetical protein D9619_003935 [Psilocybe cf. subviscida]|uniref:Transmembrane protein n=1 Tax=Psilocybe cf. subviscida TaxID=2480587 RepID=A0A8H5BQ26_9AGAR|nr:hypothetical protein D9619_003935 [Psilocybe cf. subviscida]